jgi:thiol-disulfide isomerase/thioredoxin
MRRTALATGLALAALLAALPASGRETPKDKADAISGLWDASLAIPSGDVTFGLELSLKGDVVKGAVYNGPERQEFTSGTFDGTTLTLRFDYYDGQIAAHLTTGDRAELTGEYARQTSRGIGRYQFRAVRRPSGPKAGDVSSLPSMAGEWVLTLRDKDGKVDEIDGAVFGQGKSGPFGAERGVAVTGTIIPVSGDYGLFGGALWKDEGGSVRFRMSRFDGIHVTRFWGELLADGTLKGELASGQSYHVALTGVRREIAEKNGELPDDPFKVTTVKDPTEPFRFAGVDPGTGKNVASTDARFAGKVVLVDIFGTWCPNCHDEAPVLQDLYRRYRKDGLEIVALAYEYTDDVARNKRQIDVFRRKYGIEFPILMVGTTAEGQIAKTLPQLQNFGAYPTTIFLGRDGRVRKIHAGFSGPATGHHFEEAKAEMEGLVRELLAERAASGG